jgi:putative flippase GtrA
MGYGMLKYLFRYTGVGTAIYCLAMVEYHVIFTLMKSLPKPATLAWLVCFIISTPWVHALHRRFTFMDEECKIPYVRSLLRTYQTYALSTALGAAIIYFACDIGPFSHLMGWIFSAALGSCINFYLLAQYAIRAPRKEMSIR